MAFCKECGAELPENAKFCLNCGTRISETNIENTANNLKSNSKRMSEINTEGGIT